MMSDDQDDLKKSRLQDRIKMFCSFHIYSVVVYVWFEFISFYLLIYMRECIR